MNIQLAREKAGEAWCRPETSSLVMIPKLAEAFAEILDEVWSKSWLGNATTGELLDELKTRSVVNGSINYKPIEGGKDAPELHGKNGLLQEEIPGAEK